jgi:hypothetical protein
MDGAISCFLLYGLSGSSSRSEFDKRGQLFRVHNEAFSVVAMRISNEARSPLGFKTETQPPTPTVFAELVGDNFPV